MLTFSATSFAVDERVSVEGSRIPGGGGTTIGIGGGGRGEPGRKPMDMCPPTSDSCGGSVDKEDPNRCVARFNVINKPTPLCGSYGELPTFQRGNFKQTFLTCKNQPEYLWKEEFAG